MAFRLLLARLPGSCGLLLCPTTPAAAAPAAPTHSWPSISVYSWDAALVDQDGTALLFATSSGKPQRVTMFRSSSKFVCPLVIDTLRETESELPNSSPQRTASADDQL